MAMELPESAPSIDVDTIREHHVSIMQLINLPTLVPLLHKYQLLPEEDLKRVSDSKHHGTIERTGFLLHSLYKKDQAATDIFVQCLREEKEHSGHQEILSLLETGLPDQPDRSPLFEILDSQMSEIVRLINITVFLNSMTNSGAIKISSFLDLANPDRSIEDNMQRLLRILEEKGTAGFINFLSCLRMEAVPSHEQLFELLFQKVQVFFKEHPRHDEIAVSDKIEILQLETREKAYEQAVVERFEKNSKTLEESIQLSELLPSLQKYHVLSPEDVYVLNGERNGQRKKNQLLLKLIREKTPFWVVRFSECLREAPGHGELAKLLLPDTHISKESQDKDKIIHKKDKIMVVVHMGDYIEVDKYYKKTNTRNPNEDLKEKCEILCNQFVQMDFEVIKLELKSSSGSGTGDDGDGSGTGDNGDGGSVGGSETSSQQAEEENRVQRYHEQHLADQFREEVASKCTDEAIVFMYISGVQFPFEDPSNTTTDSRFTGAVLLSEAAMYSRKEMDILKSRDILGWLSQIPQAHVTLLVDCEQSFVARYGKQREPELVEIVEDPWNMLTGLKTSTVVYFLQPDIRAMAQLRNKDVSEIAGMLTKGFVFALRHCSLRRAELGLCHRRFYEAVSFYWHRRGRQHKAFVPAVGGDVGREFLGKRPLPYNQFFRVDLVKSTSDPGTLFDLTNLHVQTGTVGGFSYGDKVMLYHLLYPGLHVEGTITAAQALNCTVKIVKEDSLMKLNKAVTDIYQDKDLRTKDGSTEFLCVFRVLPLHERVSVSTDGLSEGERATIKLYTESSPQLTYSTRSDLSDVVVKKTGDGYFAEDKHGDVTVETKAEKLSLILTYLEMIAWYKYVKRLKCKSRGALNKYGCFLTAEKPLLHTAVPLCNEFRIKWSSYEGAGVSEKGHGMILQMAEPSKFWIPNPQSKDPQPCLEVAFDKENHVITAVELKGDINENKFVERADIYHQRYVYNKYQDGPNSENLSKTVTCTTDEPVQFVTIIPLEMAKKDSFSISFKIIHKVFSENKIVPRVVENLGVINWSYHQKVGTKWKLTPSPSPDGRINLQPTGYSWITWYSQSKEPITFDLGVSGLKVAKIDFTSIGEANFLTKFSLKMQTYWKKEEPLRMQDAWPRKHEFSRPLIISNIQLWPAVPKPTQQQLQKQQSDVRMQLQLYGNKHGKVIEVEEGEILSFHFANYTPQSQFVYVLCLEETGNVKLVLMDLSERMLDKVSILKKLIQTYIPKGQKLGQIKDTYKVFVCPRKIDLEPFKQRSLYEYHLPWSYSVCSLGHKEMKNEEWCDFTFEVVVKKSTSRK